MISAYLCSSSFFSHAYDEGNSDQPCYMRGSEIWTHRATSENARQPLQPDTEPPIHDEGVTAVSCPARPSMTDDGRIRSRLR